ncbi:MAG: thioredoxin family protein [Proteobacteria bacterium]|nr:thioredoxin family protein [Pseudomonadota bacterium]
MTRFAALFATLLLTSTALASGSASPKPPAPPEVDFGVLPASADQRPDNQDGKPHQVQARLLADHDTAHPGDTFRVGLHLTQDEEWHTYYKWWGGMIGLPTRLNWTLPEGATVTEYAFPTPQRFDQSDLVSYGYEDQTLIMAEITLPEGMAAGEHSIGLDADWLVCKEQCIPGEVKDLSLPLTVVADGPAAGNSFTELFDHYEEQLPTPITDVSEVAVEFALSASAVRPYDTFKAAVMLTPIGDAKIDFPVDVASWPVFTPSSSFDWMMLDATVQTTESGALIAIIEGEAYEPEPLPTDAKIGGLFQFVVNGEPVASEITFTLPWDKEGAEVEPSVSPIWSLVDGSGGGAETIASATAEAPVVEGSLLGMLGMAFLGGLLLNLMPCVLPVLTLKLFGLVSHADATPAQQKKSGMAYTGGILASFGALAIAVLMLKASAGAVGWGFQFQSPTYVAVLGALIFAFALSMFGVFEVPALGADGAANASAKEGLAGDFLNGVFATLLATPCTAPFLGPAVGFAFAQSAPVVVLFFLVIGFGLALPFLAVAFVPALFKMMPQPGAWMETFKQVMGFTLLGTTVWLVDILAAQVGSDGAIGYLAFLCFVGFAAWMFGHFAGVAASGQRQATVAAAGLGVILLGGWGFLELEYSEVAECDDGSVAAELDFAEEVPWQKFSEERLAALTDKPVFIDFTADWCLTCKANEKGFINTEPVREAMSKCGVVPLKADWTRRDPVITEWLKRYGRAGVPFYLMIPPDGGAPVALPEVLTTDRVIGSFSDHC